MHVCVCVCLGSRQSLGEGGLADLEATREDVVNEVLNTPRRREDNDITRLTEKMHLLQVCLSVSFLLISLLLCALIAVCCCFLFLFFSPQLYCHCYASAVPYFCDMPRVCDVTSVSACRGL